MIAKFFDVYSNLQPTQAGCGNKRNKLLKNHPISSLRHLLVQPNAFQLGKISSAISVDLDF